MNGRVKSARLLSPTFKTITVHHSPLSSWTAANLIPSKYIISIFKFWTQSCIYLLITGLNVRRMKLTLIFIAIVSMVGLSQQQRFLNEQWMSSYLFDLAIINSLPSTWSRAVTSTNTRLTRNRPSTIQWTILIIHNWIKIQIYEKIMYQSDEGVEEEQSIEASYPDNQGRVKAKTFLFRNMFSSLISANLAALNPRSLTSTTFKTVVKRLP